MKIPNIIALLFILILSSCQREDAVTSSDNIARDVAMIDLWKIKENALPYSIRLSGTAISDGSDGNIAPNTLILQALDHDIFLNRAGVKIIFDKIHGFKPGDLIEVDILINTPIIKTGSSLSFEKVLLQNARKTGSNSVTPIIVASDTIKKYPINYMNTLVYFPEGKFTGSGKVGTASYQYDQVSYPVSIVNNSALAATDYPQISEGLTGILVGDSNAPQIHLRTVKDLQIGGGSAFFTDPMDEIRTTGRDPAFIYEGFSTQYSSGAHAFYLPGGTGPDASFTQSGRNYLYMDTYNDGFSFKPNAFIFERLKSVKITFAGSKLGINDKVQIEKYTLKGYPTRDQNDFVQLKVQVYNAFETDPLFIPLAESPKYYDTGVWHTLTIKIPKGKGELKALGLSGDVTLSNELYYLYSSKTIDFINASSLHLGPNGETTWVDNGVTYSASLPIMISKIEYSYY